MAYLMRFTGKCKNFTDYTYKEEYVVKDGLTEVKFEESRNALLLRGFEEVKDVAEGSKNEGPMACE